MNCNLTLEQLRTILTIIASSIAIASAIVALLHKCYQRIKLRVNASIILEDGDYYLKLENNGGNTINNINIKFEGGYLQELRSIASDFIDNNYTIELLKNITTIQNNRIRLEAGEIKKTQLTPFVNIYDCRGLIGDPESMRFNKYQENIEQYLSKSEVVNSNLPFSKTIIIKRAK